MKMLFAIIGLFILLIWVALMFSSNGKKIEIGIYDPDKMFVNDGHISLQAEYYTLSEKTNLQQKTTGRNILITLEPWPSDVYSNDEMIRFYCQRWDKSGTEVYFRWGHEMELSNSRYPWANQNPSEYIKNYQYFVSECKKFNSNYKFVWSPAGEKGLEKYWPGAEYVDYVGLSIFSFDEWEKINFKKQRSFMEIFLPKYLRVIRFQKPIIITEMGVTGSDENQVTWLSEANKWMKYFSWLNKVVYFNAQDTAGVWGENVSTPDWRITVNGLRILTNNNAN